MLLNNIFARFVVVIVFEVVDEGMWRQSMKRSDSDDRQDAQKKNDARKLHAI